MKASRVLCRFLLLLLLLPAGFSAGADDSPAQSPHLQISSIYGDLEVSRPSSIFVVLQNNAMPSEEPDELGFNKENASSIVAQLQSSDDRIKIFSGPQNAGLLAAGENATVQFMALAEDVPLGIYPLQLRLNYSRLSQVTASGGERTPNFVFAYEKASIELPLQAKVVLGPKIELEELEGETLPGIESSRRLVLVNRGDEPALDFRCRPAPAPPFSWLKMVKSRLALHLARALRKACRYSLMKMPHQATMPCPARSPIGTGRTGCGGARSSMHWFMWERTPTLYGCILGRQG